MKSGWLNINKPCCVTSTQIVNILKRKFRPKKIGHGGTLDPFASGVLPICVNEATKTVEYMMDHDKTYLFQLTFGKETDSYDIDGNVINENGIVPTENEILQVIPNFIGRIKQTPPKYSAIKIDGKRACDIMRDGGNVDIEAREIDIFNIKYNGFVNENTVEFIVDCGRGTYIRTLGIDIAKSLNCLAFVSKLTRLRVGKFNIEDSLDAEKIDDLESNLININNVLDMPEVVCSDEELKKLSYGIMINKDGLIENTIYKVLNYNKDNVCFLAKIEGKKMKAIKSFHY